MAQAPEKVSDNVMPCASLDEDRWRGIIGSGGLVKAGSTALTLIEL